MRTTGEIIKCGPTENSEWFTATVGGLGLTGVILTAKIQLTKFTSPWMDTETLHFNNLEEFFYIHESSKSDWEHTVSWIDPTSNKNRGFFMRGNPSVIDKPDKNIPRPRSIRFSPPFSLVNKYSYRPLNIAYYYKQKIGSSKKTLHYESFLYPLDNLLDWNKLYGPNGFFQYQCLLPLENSEFTQSYFRLCSGLWSQLIFKRTQSIWPTILSRHAGISKARNNDSHRLPQSRTKNEYVIQVSR